MAGIPASDDQGVWSWDEPATKLWLHNNMCGSAEHTEARKGHCQALVHDHAIRGDVLLLLSPQYLSKGTVASNHRPLLPVGPRLKLMAAIKALKGTCLSKESEEAYRGTVSVMPPGGDPEQWSPSQVKAWLIALGLGQFADAFEEQEVDGSCVAGSDPEPSLTEDVLAELGVVKLGDILRFRRACNRLVSQAWPPLPEAHLVGVSGFLEMPGQRSASLAVQAAVDGAPAGHDALGDLSPRASPADATDTRVAMAAQPVAAPASTPGVRSLAGQGGGSSAGAGGGAGAGASAGVERRRDAVDLIVLSAAPLVIGTTPVQELDTEGERKQFVKQRLSEVRRVDVDVRVKFGVATLENLLSAVATTEASVLHLSCHAAGESSSDHVLVLENEYGAGDAVSAQRLEQLCRQVAPSGTKLDLVVVSACHSEVSAQAFVTANVKSIIAVQSHAKVADESATHFAKHLFSELFRGATVFDAFQSAKAFVSAMTLSRGWACCCAHSHRPGCAWIARGGHHTQHDHTRCCCRGGLYEWHSRGGCRGHDESAKFMLLGPGPHDAIFHAPPGELRDVTPAPPPTNLPRAEKLEGRNVRIQKTIEALLVKRLVVLLGAPGVGKSSVAVAVARYLQQRRRFADGVFLVSLDGLEAGSVPYAISSALKLQLADAGNSSAVEAELVAVLSKKEVLLVFDNCDGLLGDDTMGRWCKLLGRIMRSGDGVHAIVTSRNDIDATEFAGVKMGLPELDLEAAIHLIQRSCRVTRSIASELATICGRFPLALRVISRTLANSHSGVTPSQLLQRLRRPRHRLGHLRDLNHAGSECLDTAIRSSYEALTPTLQVAFLGLHAFTAKFDEAAATALIAPNPKVTESEGTWRADVALRMRRLLSAMLQSRRSSVCPSGSDHHTPLPSVWALVGATDEDARPWSRSDDDKDDRDRGSGDDNGGGSVSDYVRDLGDAGPGALDALEMDYVDLWVPVLSPQSTTVPAGLATPPIPAPRRSRFRSQTHASRGSGASVASSRSVFTSAAGRLRRQAGLTREMEQLRVPVPFLNKFADLNGDFVLNPGIAPAFGEPRMPADDDDDDVSTAPALPSRRVAEQLASPSLATGRHDRSLSGASGASGASAASGHIPATAAPTPDGGDITPTAPARGLSFGSASTSSDARSGIRASRRSNTLYSMYSDGDTGEVALLTGVVPVDALSALCKLSLVEFNRRARRYSMHDVVRLFAQQESGALYDRMEAPPSPQPLPINTSSAAVAAGAGFSGFSLAPGIAVSGVAGTAASGVGAGAGAGSGDHGGAHVHQSPVLGPQAGGEERDDSWEALRFLWRMRFIHHYAGFVASVQAAYGQRNALFTFDNDASHIEAALTMGMRLARAAVREVDTVTSELHSLRTAVLADAGRHAAARCDASKEPSASPMDPTDRTPSDGHEAGGEGTGDTDGQCGGCGCVTDLLRVIDEQRTHVRSDALRVVAQCVRVAVGGRDVLRVRVGTEKRAELYLRCVAVCRAALARCPCGWGAAFRGAGSEQRWQGFASRRGSLSGTVRGAEPRGDSVEQPRQTQRGTSGGNGGRVGSRFAIAKAPVCGCPHVAELVEALACALTEFAFTMSGVREPHIAEAAYLEALACLRWAFGDGKENLLRFGNHTHALLEAEIQNFLAITYTLVWPDKSKYRPAAHLYDTSLATRLSCLGAGHPVTATSMNDKANFLHNHMRHGVDGAADQAKVLYEQSLEIRQRCLAEHPHTAQSLNNLGNMYLYQKPPHYENAQNYLIKALEMREKLLGPYSLDYAATNNNLGILYRNQGDHLDIAEKYLTTALKIRRRYPVVGVEQVAKSLCHLALLETRRKRFAKALQYYDEALTIRKQHDTTAAVSKTYSAAAHILQQMGDTIRAAEYAEKAKRLRVYAGPAFRQVVMVGLPLAPHRYPPLATLLHHVKGGPGAAGILDIQRQTDAKVSFRGSFDQRPSSPPTPVDTTGARPGAPAASSTPRGPAKQRKAAGRGQRRGGGHVGSRGRAVGEGSSSKSARGSSRGSRSSDDQSRQPPSPSSSRTGTAPSAGGPPAGEAQPRRARHPPPAPLVERWSAVVAKPVPARRPSPSAASIDDGASVASVSSVGSARSVASTMSAVAAVTQHHRRKSMRRQRDREAGPPRYVITAQRQDALDKAVSLVEALRKRAIAAVLDWVGQHGTHSPASHSTGVWNGRPWAGTSSGDVTTAQGSGTAHRSTGGVEVGDRKQGSEAKEDAPQSVAPTEASTWTVVGPHRGGGGGGGSGGGGGGQGGTASGSNRHRDRGRESTRRRERQPRGRGSRRGRGGRRPNVGSANNRRRAHKHPKRHGNTTKAAGDRFTLHDFMPRAGLRNGLSAHTEVDESMLGASPPTQ